MNPPRSLLGIMSLVVVAFSCLIATPVRAAEPAGGNDPNTFSMLALGDSYTAGNGAGEYFDTRGCRRSSKNYVRELQRLIEASYVGNVFVQNQACSGTVTQDFWQAFTRDGQRQPPMFESVNLGYDAIFLTTGGNDLNFGDIVKFCFVAGQQDGANCNVLLNAAQNMLDGTQRNGKDTLKDNLLRVLRGIQQRARADAKIVLLGYPYLEGDLNFKLRSGRGKDRGIIEVGKKVRQIGLTGDAVQQEVVRQLNSEAGRQQFTFAPTKELFAGPPSHELFAPNSYGDTTPYQPNANRWFIQPFTDADFSNRDLFYHPNATGWHEEAEMLFASPQVPKVDGERLAILTSTLPNGKVGDEYRTELTTTDHREGAWAVVSGALPAGLSLDGYVISGTPLTPGANSFRLRFSDGYGHTPERDATLTISPDSTVSTSVIGFDDLVDGEVVTTQYPGVAFSSTGGNVNYVTSQSIYNGSKPSFICSGGQQIDCTSETIIDFASPVSAVKVSAMGINELGPVASIDVSRDGTALGTFSVVGHAGVYEPEVQDLTSYGAITRLRIYSITDGGGIGWDDLTYSPS